MVPAGNARDAHEQDTVANDGSFCPPHWKHSHRALFHRMLVGMGDGFSGQVQVGQSFAPTSSPPSPQLLVRAVSHSCSSDGSE